MLQKVSVIIPAYNAEKTINRCLDALLDQSYQRDLYEIIVVNDGSLDKTADIVKGYPVRYISQENKGPASARNKGAEAAEGEIILFTDSDCVPDKNWISEMVKPFNDPEASAVKGAYRTHQSGIVARFSQLEFEERFEMLKKVKSIDMVDTYSAGFRRDIFLRMGGFDCSFPVANNEDTELSYRMSRLGFKMVFNPDAIVYHLNHPDSIRRYARLKFWRGYWRMVVYKRFPEKMVKDTYTPQTLKLQVILSPLLAAGLPIAVFFPEYGLYPFLLIVLCFIFISIPFILMSFKKDAIIALFSPFLLFIRAASIGLGALWGVLHRG
jgi:cellulose synthase/poly-beta-1,6-N-acetylglucosamine synthase-like glycosyltransferase